MTSIKLKKKATALRPTYYMVLEMPPGSSTAALHDRYLSMCKAIHPDLPGNEDGTKMRELTEAWGVLKDESRRKKYDARLLFEGQNCSACSGKGTKERTLKFNRKELRTCETCNGTGQRRS